MKSECLNTETNSECVTQVRFVCVTTLGSWEHMLNALNGCGIGLHPEC